MLGEHGLLRAFIFLARLTGIIIAVLHTAILPSSYLTTASLNKIQVSLK
jgi:hypothetical protein